MTQTSGTPVPEAPETRKPGLTDLLRIRDFRFLWLGQVVSDFGDNLTYLSLLLLVNRLTGSTLALAGLAISIAVPSLVFGLISGVYVDRLDRRRVMIVSDALRGVLVLAFLFVRSADMIWFIYVVAFAVATVGTMFQPAKSALPSAPCPGGFVVGSQLDLADFENHLQSGRDRGSRCHRRSRRRRLAGIHHRLHDVSDLDGAHQLHTHYEGGHSPEDAQSSRGLDGSEVRFPSDAVVTPADGRADHRKRRHAGAWAP